MTERRGGKSSAINPVTPVLPTVSWDYNRTEKAGEVLPSEPIFPILAVRGHHWEDRSVEKPGGAQMPAPVRRRQQWKP